MSQESPKSSKVAQEIKISRPKRPSFLSNKPETVELSDDYILAKLFEE